MPIEFRCMRCNRLLRTGDDTAGRQAQCPECGALTRVPATSEGVAAPPPLAPLESERSVSPPGGMPHSEVNPAGRFPPQAPSAPPAGADSRAVASLWLGTASLVCWCCPLIGIAVAVLGMVFGVLALPSHNKGMAIAGIALAAVGLALSALNAIVGAILWINQGGPRF